MYLMEIRLVQQVWLQRGIIVPEVQPVQRQQQLVMVVYQVMNVVFVVVVIVWVAQKLRLVQPV